MTYLVNCDLFNHYFIAMVLLFVKHFFRHCQVLIQEMNLKLDKGFMMSVYHMIASRQKTMQQVESCYSSQDTCFLQYIIFTE